MFERGRIQSAKKTCDVGKGSSIFLEVLLLLHCRVESQQLGLRPDLHPNSNLIAGLVATLANTSGVEGSPR
jgi:hypothetical protein